MSIKQFEANPLMLRASSDALLRIVRSNFIVSITDPSGIIIDVNDAFCDISQYTRDELLGRSHAVINSSFHPKGFFKDMWDCIQSGKVWRGEICNRAKDGSIYWVDSIIAPLMDDKKNTLQIMSIRADITHEKQQENREIQDQALLKRMGEISGVGGWELNLKTNDLIWTDQTCIIHGLEPGHKPNLDEAIHFYAPEARPVIEKGIEEAIATGDSWDLELPFIQADGTRIWVRAVGSVEFESDTPVRLYGAFQDITERVTRENELEAIHQRITLATMSGNIAVWEYNFESNILDCDAIMRRFYEIEDRTAPFTFEDWLNKLHPDDRARTEQTLQSSINDDRQYHAEFRVMLNNGQVRHVQGAGIVNRDSNNKPVKMTGVNWDVTEARELEKEVSNQRELLQVTLESIGDAVITTDAYGLITFLNPVAQHMTGWSHHDAQGHPLEEVFHVINDETQERVESVITECLDQRSPISHRDHLTLIAGNGEQYGIEQTSSPIINQDGTLFGVAVTFRDVTEQRRLSSEIHYRAKHDELTGLINRSEFDIRLQQLLDRTRGTNAHHAMLYIDLDQFKIVNDTSGHRAGDQLLRSVSGLLSEVVRSHDTLARLGGDEFGAILEDCTSQQALRAANKICAIMEEHRFGFGENKFRIGASIGLAPINRHTESVNALMQAADTSMYAAKEAGRNRVHVWSEDDAATLKKQGDTQWANRIERALDEDNFILFAQRLSALGDGQHGQHLEVLLRMVGEDGKLVGPFAFFPTAERFNLATRIDRWVVNHALAWLENHDDGAQIDLFCINLSGQSVGDKSFHAFITDRLANMEPALCSKVCFEITETSAITNLEDAGDFIEQMHQLGISIALDDFGAGASSFGYIKNLAIDVLKIDGQFIKDLLDDPLDDAAVRCFVDVAKILGLKTVAEFVDSDAILARVKELGIDYAQGFLLHKPKPLSNFEH